MTDGSYLAEFLLGKGYEVYGMHRRCSVDNYFARIDHLKGKINLVCGDLLDLGSLEKVIKEVKPDEIYNLAAQSQVRVSFDQPSLTKEINWLGVERLLGVIKEYVPHAKFYQASTSELYGSVLETPQNENTPFNPISPYAVAKLKAHEAVQRERKKGLFGCSGILFNHESERRGLEFVTRKFTDGIARFKLGLPQRETGKHYLEMGNLDARRDWGFAGDYVQAMWLIMQHSQPDDYVIATGKDHSVREFIQVASDYLNIKIRWEGKGINEQGYDQNGKLVVAVNKDFFRPAEVHMLLGDSTKAKTVLGWEPKISFNQLVEMMVKNDIQLLRNNKELPS